MKITAFDCHVIYGWHPGLKQWHITAIIPVNFTILQTKAVVSLNVAATSLATQHLGVRTIFVSKGEKIELFLPE